MLIFKRVNDLQEYVSTQKRAGKTIGFAPTMGALHKGHLSLIEQAKNRNDISICSIFVNPTQFNEEGDLKKYPRTPEKDIEMLTTASNDVLFMPDVEEVYPKNTPIKSDFKFGELEKVMEGAFRPGHFEGMAQVVNRLLEIVQPTSLYMGQKDFQQLTIVREMLRQTKSEVELVMCPIVREEDGLAMSSRNVRLTPENRKSAVIISQTLREAKARIENESPKMIKEAALEKLNSVPDFKAEYFDIVDGVTLLNLERFEDTTFAVACVAVWSGDVRLIDNIILKN